MMSPAAGPIFLFPFLPDYCNETVYLVRITLVYPISAVMETVEALQAVHCIKGSVNSIVFSIFYGIFQFVGPPCHRTSVRFTLSSEISDHVPKVPVEAVHPLVVIMAALRLAEGFFRKDAGAVLPSSWWLYCHRGDE